MFYCRKTLDYRVLYKPLGSLVFRINFDGKQDRETVFSPMARGDNTVYFYILFDNID